MHNAPSYQCSSLARGDLLCILGRRCASNVLSSVSRECFNRVTVCPAHRHLSRFSQTTPKSSSQREKTNATRGDHRAFELQASRKKPTAGFSLHTLVTIVVLYQGTRPCSSLISLHLGSAKYTHDKDNSNRRSRRRHGMESDPDVCRRHCPWSQG